MKSLQSSALTVVFWRAVRLAAPLALISCGASVKVIDTRPPACAPPQRATCASGSVQVETDLPHGHELGFLDCDRICLPVQCTSERKSCHVESQPLTNAKVVVCQHAGFDGCPVPGRPPAGLVLPPPTSVHEVYAQMALAEAASVASFDELAAFLDQAGAPEALVKRARKAAKEEQRHARVAARLAGLSQVPVAPLASRSQPLTLAQLAAENFCDGCINEGASAVVTASQARNATDAGVRTALARVAMEELGHAELSWDLHAWLVPRLSAVERIAVRAAGLRKAASMLRPMPSALDEAALAQTGIPSDACLREQHRLLFTELWAPALAQL